MNACSPRCAQWWGHRTGLICIRQRGTFLSRVVLHLFGHLLYMLRIFTSRKPCKNKVGPSSRKVMLTRNCLIFLSDNHVVHLKCVLGHNTKENRNKPMVVWHFCNWMNAFAEPGMSLCQIPTLVALLVSCSLANNSPFAAGPNVLPANLSISANRIRYLHFPSLQDLS